MPSDIIPEEILAQRLFASFGYHGMGSGDQTSPAQFGVFSVELYRRGLRSALTSAVKNAKQRPRGRR